MNGGPARDRTLLPRLRGARITTMLQALIDGPGRTRTPNRAGKSRLRYRCATSPMDRCMRLLRFRFMIVPFAPVGAPGVEPG